MDAHVPPAIFAEKDALEAVFVRGDNDRVEIGGITRTPLLCRCIVGKFDIHGFNVSEEWIKAMDVLPFAIRVYVRRT
jgi:hypothetical protein